MLQFFLVCNFTLPSIWPDLKDLDVCVIFYNLGTFLNLKSVQEVESNAVTLTRAPLAHPPLHGSLAYLFFNTVSTLYAFSPDLPRVWLSFGGVSGFYILKKPLEESDMQSY